MQIQNAYTLCGKTMSLLWQNHVFTVAKPCLYCGKTMSLPSETPSRSKAQQVPKRV